MLDFAYDNCQSAGAQKHSRDNIAPRERLAGETRKVNGNTRREVGPLMQTRPSDPRHSVIASGRAHRQNEPMDPQDLERYSRHLLLKEVGGQGQQKLLNARVLIIGAGGLGAPIIQYLAAAGVGTLGLVDDDEVSLSNLQRQVIYRTADIGAPKVESASKFIASLNPGVTVIPHPLRIDAKNVDDLIADYDLIVEGVDNFETRFVLNKACIEAKKTFVSAAVGRFEGQLSIFKPYENPGVLPCYRCLTPAAPPVEDQINCAEEGILGAITGVLGALAAMETLKELLSLGEPLAGRLLLYDGLGGSFRTVALPADPSCPDCAPR